MSQAWIVGEVLVDLIPAHDGDERIGDLRYRAVIGGGPANTARALARLGKSCEFVGGLSSDRFGHMAWMEFERDSVGLDLVLESDHPTAKAILMIGEDGGAAYRFEIDGTATFGFDQGWLPSGEPKVVHIGTLAAVVEPGRDQLLEWVRERRNASSLVLFDPNVRSAYLSDRDHHRDVVEEWIYLSDVVKASDEDVKWLYPDLSEDEVVAKWLDLGSQLVVVTRGARGMVGYSKAGRVEVGGVEIEIVDTVGAGDTVGAVLVEALLEMELESLVGAELERVLSRASHAAAITCSRQGANPPTLDELNESLSRASEK